MKREDFIKFIPKPQNEQVILYDLSLNNLIDVDVVEEYQKLYPIFINKRKDFQTLKNEIELYKKNIDNVFLYNPSWSEEDYLNKLRDDKKTYSILYSEIKKREDSIGILKKKIEGINKKIEIQTIKENKQKEAKIESVETDIKNNKESFNKFKDLVDSYTISLRNIEEQIKEVTENLELLEINKERLKEGNFICICCGKKMNKNDNTSIIYKRTEDYINKNTLKLKQLSEKKEKLEINLAYYKNELSKVKVALNNDLTFKKDNNNIYVKKSIDILKLEALKDEMLKKIEMLQKEINMHSESHSKKFQELKNRIQMYEESLDNLRKIKDNKSSLNGKIEEYKKQKNELEQIEKTLSQYVSFLTIYYKIYEQKANVYCGPNYKFKFFKIEEYKIIEIFNLYYNGVEYSQISKEEKEKVDRKLIEKFSIYL